MNFNLERKTESDFLSKQLNISQNPSINKILQKFG